MFGQKSSRLHGVRVRCRLESIREMYRPSIYSRLSAALAVPADGSHLAVSGESAETTDGFAAIRRRETTILRLQLSFDSTFGFGQTADARNDEKPCDCVLHGSKLSEGGGGREGC